MQQIFLTVHVLAAVALVALVLLQQGRGADAGAAFGSGSSGTLFGSRGPASFLTRATAILAAVFFLTSISLAYMVSHSDKRASVIERLQNDKTQSIRTEEISIPPVPSVPRTDNAELPDSPKGSGVDIPATSTTNGVPPAPPKSNGGG
ncbi:MAG: preprotein translocase subunit SecG [Gammaproteobacteria bacterium]|nr:preprotein translocase subunit SecG [Gammaproteobacteria bacterium]NNJ84128.1 preprotein translocase subunit SecG [Gammaproteobacteria bacterium]